VKWLEDIYEIPAEYQDALNQTSHGQDFDCDPANPIEHAKEMKNLRTIYEHLRAGKVFEIQQQLEASGIYHHALMIKSLIPAFDNLCSVDFNDDPFIFDVDIEKQNTLDTVSSFYGVGDGSHVINGNPCFLLAVD